ncbi:hypothetical protein GJ496_004545 [Pomphorhynchus laevis]|nr:hypothetical protein GJ496_004545 [Pomphorhynchus laevis]KAI0979430.1 hypothetical protein GJ496_004545 [Pomphorhynchus laevis]
MNVSKEEQKIYNASQTSELDDTSESSSNTPQQIDEIYEDIQTKFQKIEKLYTDAKSLFETMFECTTLYQSDLLKIQSAKYSGIAELLRKKSLHVLDHIRIMRALHSAISQFDKEDPELNVLEKKIKRLRKEHRKIPQLIKQFDNMQDARKEIATKKFNKEITNTVINCVDQVLSTLLQTREIFRSQHDDAMKMSTLRNKSYCDSKISIADEIFKSMKSIQVSKLERFTEAQEHSIIRKKRMLDTIHREREKISNSAISGFYLMYEKAMKRIAVAPLITMRAQIQKDTAAFHDNGSYRKYVSKQTDTLYKQEIETCRNQINKLLKDLSLFSICNGSITHSLYSSASKLMKSELALHLGSTIKLVTCTQQYWKNTTKTAMYLHNQTLNKLNDFTSKQFENQKVCHYQILLLNSFNEKKLKNITASMENIQQEILRKCGINTTKFCNDANNNDSYSFKCNLNPMIMIIDKALANCLKLDEIRRHLAYENDYLRRQHGTFLKQSSSAIYGKLSTNLYYICDNQTHFGEN